MSVISTRTSCIASILKNPKTRATLVGVQKKLSFQLPTDLSEILINVECKKNDSRFEELMNIIRHAQIKDTEFIKLLNDVRECISILKPVHKSFVEVLLDIEWRTMSLEVTSLYKKFIDDLMDMHSYYYKFVIDKLLTKLTPSADQNEWEGLEFPQEELDKANHVHDIFQTLLKNRPLSTEIFMKSLKYAYPHYFMGTHVNKVYLLHLLRITEYAPTLRRDILFMIFDRLVFLDVRIPMEDLEECNDLDMTEDDINSFDAVDSNIVAEITAQSIVDRNQFETIKKLIHTFDVSMEVMFAFVHRKCYENGKLNMDELKSLLHDLIYCFDNIILRTHASHHVQFIMFYICNLKSNVLDAFVRFLWLKISDLNAPSLVRQYAVCYISSLLARSKITPLSLLHEVISEMANWIHSYIQQDNLQNVNNDMRAHVVFYAICQGLFYLIAFRNKELTDGKKNLMFLQNLNLTKIISCKLNPLKVCQPAVVQNFAAVTRNYQLAYCYTIIERNKRMTLPVLNCNSDMVLETFFPFDPYILKLSKHWIQDHYYYSSQIPSSATSESMSIDSPKNVITQDEDDFMEESFSLSNESAFDKFSYGSSPGFCKNIYLPP